jgi:hypothetical protein
LREKSRLQKLRKKIQTLEDRNKKLRQKLKEQRYDAAQTGHRGDRGQDGPGAAGLKRPARHWMDDLGGQRAAIARMQRRLDALDWSKWNLPDWRSGDAGEEL